ncbi:MAG: hypothetical protein KJP00_10820, partial [Bacteroidia bacterium]|nr:hypothetical protein [Bacteroidia bacterium]
PSRMTRKSHPISSMGMLLASANLAAPALYNVSVGAGNLFGGGGLVIDVYPPGPTGLLPDIDDPSLNLSGFYLRYETSLKGYDIYRDVWNRSRFIGFNFDPCEYFRGRTTAPPYIRIKTGDYKISSSYRLNSIFQNNVSDHRSEDILNFNVQ